MHLNGTPARTRTSRQTRSASSSRRWSRAAIIRSRSTAPPATHRSARSASTRPRFPSRRRRSACDGERQALNFSLPNAAPPGGTLLDIATDVPESVIMPEVIVPQGQTTRASRSKAANPAAAICSSKVRPRRADDSGQRDGKIRSEGSVGLQFRRRVASAVCPRRRDSNRFSRSARTPRRAERFQRPRYPP